MNHQEKAMFEAHTLLQAHANVLSSCIANGKPVDVIMAQLATVKEAADAFAKIPTQQQKAA